MKSVIAPSETKQNDTPANPPANPIADKVAKLEAHEKAVKADYDAVINADLAFSKAVVAAGFDTLCLLARDHGASVDKFGYPSRSAYRRLVNAAEIRSVSHKQFDALCGIIRSA